VAITPATSKQDQAATTSRKVPIVMADSIASINLISPLSDINRLDAASKNVGGGPGLSYLGRSRLVVGGARFQAIFANASLARIVRATWGCVPQFVPTVSAAERCRAPSDLLLPSRVRSARGREEGEPQSKSPPGSIAAPVLAQAPLLNQTHGVV
jgi:hypothetical protein